MYIYITFLDTEHISYKCNTHTKWVACGGCFPPMTVGSNRRTRPIWYVCCIYRICVLYSDMLYIYIIIYVYNMYIHMYTYIDSIQLR